MRGEVTVVEVCTQPSDTWGDVARRCARELGLPTDTVPYAFGSAPCGGRAAWGANDIFMSKVRLVDAIEEHRAIAWVHARELVRAHVARVARMHHPVDATPAHGANACVTA